MLYYRLDGALVLLACTEDAHEYTSTLLTIKARENAPGTIDSSVKIHYDLVP